MAQAAPFLFSARFARLIYTTAMRLRVWLPILQTAAMLLILWAPWNPQAHEIELMRADGSDVKIWTLIPGPSAVEWAMGVNLPALTLATPVEFALRKPDALPNIHVRFYGLWLIGILCWYMIGRFLDDLLEWRHSGVLPRKHWADLTFALIALPSAILLADAFALDRAGPTSLAVSSILWLVLTGAAFVFRVVQVIKQRRKPVVA